MRKRLYTLISLFLFAILYLYTAIGVVVIMILMFLKIKKPMPFLRQQWARSVFLLMGKRFTIEGRQNIDPHGRYILVANHSSLFDIIAIMSFFPDIAWFGHERLLRVPVFGRMLEMTDYVPFRKPTFNNTKKMIDELSVKAARKSVAIFPEGTRTLSGSINDFYKGFVYLMRTSGIGILPVTLNGFYKLKPKNRAYINFDSKLNVIVHKPISRSELIDKSDTEIISTVKSVIESAYRHI